MRPESGSSGRARASWVDGVIIASVLPLLAKAVDYALIGSYLPLLASVLAAALAATAIATASPRLRKAAIACWAAVLILWASARLGLLALHLILGVPEAHIAGQFTLVYLAISAAYLVAGVYLFRWRRGSR